MANNALTIRKAERKKSKMRLGIAGPSGSGKTWGALQVAFGIGLPTVVIDTEAGSADLYEHLGEFSVIPLSAPYSPERYVEAIKLAEREGFGTIIIDSLTHAWAGVGGCLDQQGRIASRSGNGFTAWRDVTPQHNALVDAMLQSSCHVIACLRSKTEHIQEKDDRGKTVIRKIGMAPIQRDGLEYEFTACLELEWSHLANSSKDRTGLFDGQTFKLTQETGRRLLEWLDKGADVAPIAEGSGPDPVQPPAKDLSRKIQDHLMAVFTEIGKSVEGATNADVKMAAIAFKASKGIQSWTGVKDQTKRDLAFSLREDPTPFRLHVEAAKSERLNPTPIDADEAARILERERAEAVSNG